MLGWRLLSFSSRVLQNTVTADFTALKRCVLPSTFIPTINISAALERNYSIFVKISGEDLRGGAQGVSRAGKKKGRGKRGGKSKIGNLNIGQTLGLGYGNLSWPGLNGPVFKSGSVAHVEQLPPNPERERELLQHRDQVSKPRFLKLAPLERGYSSTKLPGQRIGPPDPIADYTFEGFDTIVLEFKTVSAMTGTLGRRKKYSVFVVTGNGNGIAGYGLGKALTTKSAIRLAKNKAAQKLMYIPMFENHTVYHNMHTEYQNSRIFIHKREEGYGLQMHRVLKSICQIMGIKNLHCKVEGSTKNIQSVTKAFFNGLIHQELHSDLSERLGYHVVEMRKEEDYRPKVIASPANLKEEPIVDEEEDIEADFNRIYYGGRCELPKRPIAWAHLKDPKQIERQKKKDAMRNQPQARVMRLSGLI